MAYSNNYTFMYGFSLLDDLHNFFPEILYDDALFPEQRLGWFRHRTSTLFPSVFPRQMNMYRIYNAAERHRMYQEWVNSQTIGIAQQPNGNTWVNNPPPQVPPVDVRPAQVPTSGLTHVPVPAPATPSASTVAGAGANTSSTGLRPVTTHRYVLPARTYSQAASLGAIEEQIQNSAANILMRMAVEETTTTTVPQTPQRPPAPALPTAPLRRGVTGGRAATLGSDVDILTALFTLPTVPSNNVRAAASTSPLNSLFGANEILSLLTNGLNFQDVVVVPTLNQIEAGSRIILHGDVPPDENCAICQEHSIPGQQSPWRRLHCSHQFHTACIMPWFQRNVHCPVCRADVRELESEAGTGETGASTPSDDMSVTSSDAPTDNAQTQS